MNCPEILNAPASHTAPLARARLLALASVVAIGVAAPAAVLAPRVAQACGGTFCDGGTPSPMPVDQTGENILFIVDREENTVEAQIQIQYTGDASKFSWVIPVTSIPQIGIGSEQLFQNILDATVPTYQLTNVFDCQETDNGPALGCGAADGFAGSSDSGAESGGSSGFDPTGTGGPQVVFTETVGPYNVDVLQGGTAQELIDWLDANGYAQDPNATPIIEQYLAEDHLFAAVKLVNGADVNEIQPLTLTYDGIEPCVPLRLTRIAAVDDMAIRVFFLGDARMAPTNYRHVLVNPARIDWVNNAANYNDVITQAADGEGETEGRAFVTEYAGSSNLISSAGLFSSAWEQVDFTGVDSPIIQPGYTAIDALEGAGLVECSGFDESSCQFFHPMMEPLLQQFLPPPDGVAAFDYWRDIENFEGLIDPQTWDGEAFTTAIRERIVDPGKHAEDLLATWSYATRMFTRISPHEMMEDPIFHENADLPDVSNTNTAQQFIPCRGSNKVVFDNGDELLLDGAGNWPDLPDAMPWVEAVQEVPMTGAPQVMGDFRAAITEQLEEANSRFEYDNGTGGCTVRPMPRNLGGLAMVGFVFGLAFVGRRRR